MSLRSALSAFICAAILAPNAVAQAETLPEVREYQILRDGSPFGVHRLTLQRDGERLTVRNQIEAQVQIAGLTLFRFSHASNETWKGGQLVAMDSRTDEDGAVTQFSAQRTASGILVEGTPGRFVAPPDTAPTSFWRKDVLKRQHLLELTTGELLSVEARRLPTSQGAEHWLLDGTTPVELTYDAEGQLKATKFTARGSVFEYQPLVQQAQNEMILQ